MRANTAPPTPPPPITVSSVQPVVSSYQIPFEKIIKYKVEEFRGRKEDGLTEFED